MRASKGRSSPFRLSQYLEAIHCHLDVSRGHHHPRLRGKVLDWMPLANQALPGAMKILQAA